MLRWIAFGAAAAVLAAMAFAYVFRGDLALILARRGAEAAMQTALQEQLPDGLHVLFCGTGSPLPERGRAGPCTAVVAGSRIFVFDAGEGAAETLALMGVRQADIDAVFLTHLHSDHFDGLAPLALQHWATGPARSPLEVVGPAGVERIAAGLNEAYAIDAGYRTAHHGPDTMPPSGAGLRARPFEPPQSDGAALVLYDSGGVRIAAFRVDHAPTDAVGYRVDYAGRSVVVSGDTARSASLTEAARGADMLVHEVISPELNRVMRDAARAGGRGNVAAIFDDILDYHTAPEEAGAVAQEAGVDALALTHFLPQTPIPALDAVFVRAARRSFDGPVWAMRDGDVVSLPRAGGVERANRLRYR